MKKLYLILLLMALCALPSRASYNILADNYWISIINGNQSAGELTCAIVGVNPNSFPSAPSGVLTIPDKISYYESPKWTTYKVISIDLGGNYQSAPEPIHEIVLPETITTISGFSGWTDLQNINIPAGVKQIYGGAFSRCSSLKSITLPEGLEYMGNSCFSKCTSLETITVPSSLQGDVSGERWFAGCTSLKSAVVNARYKTLVYTFEECTALESVQLNDEITELSGTFRYCTSLQQIDLPRNLTALTKGAFDGCSSLQSLKLPETVTNIGENAVYNCTSLTEINIPSGVTDIGAYAFCGCTAKGIEVPPNVVNIGQGAYSSVPFTSVTIPASTIFIGSRAFRNCPSLQKLVVEEGELLTISQYVFEESPITEIVWNRQETVGAFEFPACSSVTFGDKVSKIPNCMFLNNQVLTSISIPGSVTVVGNDALRGCSNITDLRFEDSDTALEFTPHDTRYGEAAETEFPGVQNLYLGRKVTGAIYNNASTVELGSIDAVEANQFKGFRNLSSITISPSVLTVGAGAFDGCPSLTSLNVSDAETPITFDNNVFATVTDLYIGRPWTGASFPAATQLSLSAGITEIPAKAFYGNSTLSAIDFGASITSIGESAFANCSNLVSISIPATVTKVGNNAFANCQTLSDFRIEDSDVPLTLGNTILGATNSTLTSIYMGREVTNVV